MVNVRTFIAVYLRVVKVHADSEQREDLRERQTAAHTLSPEVNACPLAANDVNVTYVRMVRKVLQDAELVPKTATNVHVKRNLRCTIVMSVTSRLATCRISVLCTPTQRRIHPMPLVQRAEEYHRKTKALKVRR